MVRSRAKPTSPRLARPSGPSPLAPPATDRNSGGWRFIVEGVALGVLALIRGIDVVDEGRRRRVRRLNCGGRKRHRAERARRKGARRRSLRFVGMGTIRAWRAFVIGNAENFRKMQE